MKLVSISLLIALLEFSIPSNATAPTYTVTDLGLGEEVIGINNAGAVLAQDASGKVLVYSQGGSLIRDLNLLPSLVSTCAFDPSEVPVATGAGGINNHGAVVFSAYPYQDPFQICIAVYANNALQFQRTLGQGGGAAGINDAGQIIGQLTSTVGDIGFGPECDFIRGGNFITAVGINNSEQIIGNSSSGAELCIGGVWKILPKFKAASAFFARALNNKGQVVGEAYISNSVHAFLYSNGKARDLGTLPEATYTSAESINDHGQIVGEAESGTGATAFIYDGGQMYDLSTLTTGHGSFQFSGVVSGVSVRINDSGVIAVIGAPLGSTTAHIYTLTPVN